jgi:hypothetical protein
MRFMMIVEDKGGRMPGEKFLTQWGGTMTS